MAEKNKTSGYHQIKLEEKPESEEKSRCLEGFSRLLSQAWIWEKLVIFGPKYLEKKPFPGSRPLWTRRLHADWPWQESMAWQTNTKSAWSWQLHNTESLAWSWWHRATPGTKLLIQDLPWKLHKLQCRARIQGFLATGLAPVAKPVNLISERLRKARKATSWLGG